MRVFDLLSFAVPCQLHRPMATAAGTCPVCKLEVGSGRPEGRDSETDGDDMV